jgi:hypothetical protein
VFRLVLPQTEGLIGSLIAQFGPDLAVPDHSTLCRRTETSEVPWPRPGTRPMPLSLTARVEAVRAGEWLTEKHGTRTGRSWRKLHIGVDAAWSESLALDVMNMTRSQGAAGGP